MNRNDIYRKTPAGEEAMIRRAKVEERKQRMILVLIDGKTSVWEMSEKVGDSALTESAIATLEAGGFVVLEKAGDNTPPPEAPLHKPVKLSQFSTFGAKENMRGADTVVPPPASHAPLMDQAEASPSAPSSAPPATSPSPVAAKQPAPQAVPVPTPPLPTSVAQPPQPQPQPQPQRSVQQVPASPSAVSTASASPVTPVTPVAPVTQPAVTSLPLSQTLPPPLTSLPRAESGGQVTASGAFTLPSFYKAPPPPPILPHPDVAVDGGQALTEEEAEAGARKRRLRWLRRGFSALGGVLLIFVIGFVGINLYSYSAEQRMLEEWLSQGLGVPVHVGQVSPVLSLKPKLELRKVQIGDTPGRNQIELIRLPGLFSRLLGLSFNAGDQVEVSGGSLDAVLLAAWKGSPAPDGMSKVRFQQIDIHLGEYALASFDGDILFTADGGLQRADLRSKPLRLEITPLDQAYTVTVLSANNWQPIPDSPLKILNLTGSMRVYPDRLFMESGDMHLLGGRYEGDLELKWQNGKVREITGKGVLTGVRIADLLEGAGFTKPAGFVGGALELEGDLSGALRFHTRGDTPELWRQNLEAHGEMKVDRSTLRGMDLIRLMRGGGSGKITRRSGLTKFSRFGFDLSVDSEGLKLEKLQLRATSLRGEGSVSIDAEGDLTGRIALLLFDGEGGPGSDLLLGGRYPLLDAELREAPGSRSVSTPTTPAGRP